MIQTSTNWISKVYDAVGTWSITEDNGQYHFVLGPDFKTSFGPDVKVYLTQLKMEDIQNRDPVDQNGIFLGEMKTFHGPLSYPIPKELNLDDYNSIVIHCKRFSVVWCGVDIVEGRK